MSVKLGEVLRRLDTYGHGDELFAPPDVALVLDTDCLVINPDIAELADDDWTPVEAAELGMTEHLHIDDIRQVQSNLLARWPDATDAELCQAINYYFDRDAFVPDDFEFA